jgi:hypothetical protein
MHMEVFFGSLNILREQEEDRVAVWHLRSVICICSINFLLLALRSVLLQMRARLVCFSLRLAPACRVG